MRYALPLLAACTALALPAAAQVSWYAGISGGQSRTDRELVRNRESTLLFASDVHTDFDARDSAWKGYVGVRFRRWLGLEVSYADLGSHRMDTRLQGGTPSAPAAIIIDREVTGVGVDAVFFLPLAGDRLDLFAKVGTFRSRLEATASLEGNIEFSGGSGERSRATKRTEQVGHYGLGMQYWVTPNLAIRAEWERYDSIGKAFEVGGSGTTGQADTDAGFVGVSWRF
jgi:opacity protein-like surface antigen